MTRDRHGRATLARRGSALAVSTLVVRTSVTAIWASVGVMVARTLGVHGRGQAAFVSSIYFVGLLALNLGYENAILNRRAELRTPPAELRRLGGFVALVAGLTGVAIVVAAKRLDPGGAFSDVRLVWLLAGVGPLPWPSTSYTCGPCFRPSAASTWSTGRCSSVPWPSSRWCWRRSCGGSSRSA